MRILQVFDCYGIPKARALPGGENGSVATVVYYLSKYLVKKGCDVTILERDLGFLPKEEYIDGIRYCRIPSKGLPAHPYKLVTSFVGLLQLTVDSIYIAKEIYNFIKREKYDIVNFHFPIAASILLSVKRDLCNFSVYTVHAGEVRLSMSALSPKVLKLFNPDIYLIKRVKKSIILNKNLIKKLIYKKNIDSEKLIFIPNGINLIEIKNNLNLYSSVDCNNANNKIKNKDTVILLFVGKIIPRKGVLILIKAIKKLVNSGIINFKLFLVGDMSIDQKFYSEILEYISKNSLSKFIEFKGFVSYYELLNLYSLCDILVVPSFEEGYGMVFSEALIFGKPVIGTRVGGIPMQIENGKNGFLVEPGNVAQLYNCIKYLIENVDKRVSMGKYGKKLVEKFDWSCIADKYLEVYNSVCRC